MPIEARFWVLVKHHKRKFELVFRFRGGVGGQTHDELPQLDLARPVLIQLLKESEFAFVREQVRRSPSDQITPAKS